jgi:hypothetical protein
LAIAAVRVRVPLPVPKKIIEDGQISKRLESWGIQNPIYCWTMYLKGALLLTISGVDNFLNFKFF